MLKVMLRERKNETGGFTAAMTAARAEWLPGDSLAWKQRHRDGETALRASPA